MITGTDLLFLGVWVLAGFAGWSICRFTHRQRGISEDNLSLPDFIPPSWDKEHEDA